MKTRQGFVGNSSSASFMIFFTKLPEKVMKEISSELTDLSNEDLDESPDTVLFDGADINTRDHWLETCAGVYGARHNTSDSLVDSYQWDKLNPGKRGHWYHTYKHNTEQLIGRINCALYGFPFIYIYGSNNDIEVYDNFIARIDSIVVGNGGKVIMKHRDTNC